MNALQLFHPSETERAIKNFQRIMQGEELGGIEYIGQKMDGKTYNVVVYALAVYKSNEVAGIRGITIDVTKERRIKKIIDIFMEYSE